MDLIVPWVDNQGALVQKIENPQTPHRHQTNMKRVIKEMLLRVLRDLNEKSLESFKRTVCDSDVPQTFDKIPWGVLEDKGAEDVVDLIIRYYTIKYGPKIAVQVLEDINERQASFDLTKELEIVDTTNMTTPHHRHPGGYEKENLVDSKENIFIQTTKVEDDCTPSTILQNVKVRRALNMSNANNTPDDLCPFLIPILKNSKVSTPKPQMGKPRPDMKLVPLTEKKVAVMLENHKGQPHKFSALLFKHYVSFSTYKKWVKNTNFDGSGGKKAIPINLRDAIFDEVRNHFSLTPGDKKQMRNTINDLLRNPRTSGWSVLI